MRGTGIFKGILPHAVTDINLAAALLSVGIPPAPKFELKLQGDHDFTGFHFREASTDGEFSFKECVEAWDQEARSTKKEEDFSHLNPDHPMSYLMCFSENKRWLHDYVKRRAGKVVISRGKSFAVINPFAPRAQQAIILNQLGV